MNQLEGLNLGGPIGRRAVLRAGSLGFLGITLGRILELEAALGPVKGGPAGKRAEACILLWLDGGPSHIDTWDPKPNSSFKPISTNVPGIRISELLPRMSKKMDKLAVIRSMHTEENNHGVAHHYAMTGHRPSPAMKFPAFSSVITKELGQRHNVPPNVMVPEISASKRDYFRSHFLGAQYDPLQIPDPNRQDYNIPELSLPGSLTLERIEARNAFLELVDGRYRQAVESTEYANLDEFRQQALNMVLSQSVRQAFDLSREPEKLKDAYGRHMFGQSVLIARRLVEAGSRFVTAFDLKRVETGRNWDTHGTNDKQHKDVLVPVLDQTLSTLLTDLEERGLLESTLVIAMGEFGRTYDLNPGGGRDHWCHCWSMVLGGGGIRGGQIIGASDERGAYVADRMVTIGDLLATIYKALGIDWTREYMHPIGRPLKIANSINDETGKPIEELI